MRARDKNYEKIDNFFLIKTLGEGVNSTVKLAYHKNEDKYYALKVIRTYSENKLTNSSNLKAILNEVQILEDLNHPNIISLYKFSQKGTHVSKTGEKTKNMTYALLEFAEGGELIDFLRFTGRFSESVTRYLFQQLIEGIKHIHDQGYAHRDLKIENLLFDQNFDLKIADFGFSIKLYGGKGDGVLDHILGTVCYMAPELHAKAPYNGKCVDIFAAGIILFILLSGHRPFDKGYFTNEDYLNIVKHNHEKFWFKIVKEKLKGNQIFSKNFQNLVNFMFAFDPTKRPSLVEIQNHRWYRETKPAVREDVVRELEARKKYVDKMLEKIKRQKKAELRKRKEAEKNGGGNAHFQGIYPC